MKLTIELERATATTEKTQAAESAVQAARTKIRAALSTEQRGLLARFQESCCMIGAHEGYARWAVLGGALEAALAAVDLGSALAAVYRGQLETYLARSDAGYGTAGIEEALRTLLGVTGAKDEDETLSTQTPSAVATESTRDGRAVRVDLSAILDAVASALRNDAPAGSPPMVVISADVARAIADFARTLSRGVAEAKSPDEARHWREFAADGPAVGGDGAADAWESGIHPIHVSTVRDRNQRSRSMVRKGETVMIPVSAIEFREGGNTLWIHGPQGGTVLRLKSFDGVITSKQCQSGAPGSHGDAIIKGNLEICLSSSSDDEALP